MQISSAQIFAFVEGGLDRPFAERVLNLFVASPTKIRVVAIKETPGGTGGKPALLDHFRRLRRKGHLLATAWGKPFVSLFFLDKDADDALGKLIRSPHVAYTTNYDLESSLVSCGNLTQAVSDACHVTTAQAEGLLGNATELLHELSRNWADWITLCLISQYKKQNFGCTFDRISAININPLAPPDANELSIWKGKIRTQLGMTDGEFNKLYARFRRLVDTAAAEGHPLKYFKGKWLKHVLQRRVESQPRIPDASIGGLADRILSVLVSHVANSPNCQCCQHYSVFVNNAISMLQTRAAA